MNPTSYTYYVGEDAAVGVTLGTVTATDGDIGTYGNIGYTLDQSSLNGAYFQVGPTTGEITLQSSLTNCACPLTALIFPVTATDGGLLTSTASVTVYVQPGPTTTTIPPEGYKGFFDDNTSIAWFCALIVSSILILGATVFICMRYVCNWPKDFCKTA